jgi:hypothetical protein
VSTTTPTETPPPIVSGDIYVFADVVATGTVTVNGVSWWLDDVTRSGPPTSTDPQAPYDFQGGSTLAVPFDTAALDPVTGLPLVLDGIHTFLVDVDTSIGVFSASGSIDVRNTVDQTYSIVVSRLADRSSPLEVARTDGVDPPDPLLAGNAYFYVSPSSDIAQVEWFVDQVAPFTGLTPVHTRTAPPFDFNGGTSTTATAYDTNLLTDTTHTIGVRITRARGGLTITANGSFVVQNTPTPTLYKIVYSTAANRGGTLTDVARSDSVTVSVPTVTGNIYPFVTPTTNIARVDFYDNFLRASFDADNNTNANAFNVEGVAPFDFVTGGTSSTAAPFVTTDRPNGQQYLGARVTLLNGTVVPMFAGNVNINNPVAPPSGTLPFKPPILETNPLVGIYYNRPSPGQSVAGVTAKVDVIDTASGSTSPPHTGGPLTEARAATWSTSSPANRGSTSSVGSC